MSLKSVLECQGSYRFYSSSLLIVYEGEETDAKSLQNKGISSSRQESLHGMVDVRMIDFAHTTFTESQNSLTDYEGPDQGYIFGLENLVKIFCDIKENANDKYAWKTHYTI